MSKEFRAKFRYCCEQARELGVTGTLILLQDHFYSVGIISPNLSKAVNDNKAKP